MSDQSAESAPCPTIAIPRNFKGATLSQFADDIIEGCPGEGWPPSLEIDFQNLAFIRPAGVAFLSNLLWWLHEQGTAVNLINVKRDVAALRYLDDSLFFEQHCGEKLWSNSAPRSTTIPLQRIAHSHSHAWLEHNLLPWLVRNIGLTQASFYALKTCLSELFNNINDHTRFDIGSIFVQHYPNEKRINLSLADFGIGIPEKVRQAVPDLSDPQAVVQAVQEGFTTRSTPGNAGLGLDYLLRTVVGTNSGEVTIYTGHAIVRFRKDKNGKICPYPDEKVGFCPGTTIDINLRTDLIEELPEEREELKW
jgi:anti-sigma regulatory factor (Ser/Thr protein kinase)